MAEKSTSPSAQSPTSLSDYLKDRKLQQQILHLIVETHAPESEETQSSESFGKAQPTERTKDSKP